MNKKGFTLIEIIVCIALLGIIGTTSGIIIAKNNKQTTLNKINNLNKKLLEAASVFISNEKDDEGIIYAKALSNGANGTKIPINYLVNKGYISSELKREVIKYNELDSKKNYYIMALNGGESDKEDYCNIGEILFQPSWEYMISKKPIYLCKNYKKYVEKIDVINNIQKVQNNSRMKVHLDKYAVSDDFYSSLSENQKENFTSSENGLFSLYDSDVDKVYTYYRGAVDNNYLKLGTKDDKDLYWRIVWMNEDNIVKLVLDEEIPLFLEKENGEKYQIQIGDELMYGDVTNHLTKEVKKLSVLNSFKCDYTNETVTTDDDCKCDSQHNTYSGKDDCTNTGYKFSSSNFSKLGILFDESFNMYNGNIFSIKDNKTKDTNYYLNELKNWYDATSLKDYNFITPKNGETNFCYNSLDIRYSYSANNSNSKTFSCKNATKDKYDSYTSNVSSKIGFLTYGDVLRAGLYDYDKDFSQKTELINSKNYLLSNSSNSYPLADTKYTMNYNDGSDFYYITNEGIKNSIFTTKKSATWGIPFYNDNAEFDSYTMNKDSIFITNFYANTVKPSIIIDLTGKELTTEKSENEGTKDNPFIVIDKK